MLKFTELYLQPTEHAQACVQSSISMWSSLRRAWASIALRARERGDRYAAVHAEQELIRCELEYTRFVHQLARLRRDAAGVLGRPDGA
jgi:hypothetical protein